ncbi:hypothetical protein TrCOL_g10147 [Triparma columacea]|uniref:tRNA-dihydrouridine(16/17) synthase [NAD(P)(+)] n=1 Tax=Triparma columacea TaxID=722753 RepID=A0A9W7GDG6_9STRA|nr:hypothetical protein TrCOL_g10147 [Triparma columacea]
MVAQSDLAFRLQAVQHGATLTYTQMLHARNFVASKKFQSDNYDFDPSLEGLSSPSGVPVIAQIAGDDVHCMVEAAKILQATGIDAIDVNLGCPQAIARKGGYGAFLGRQVDKTTEILSALTSAIDVPITAKVRIQPDLGTTLDICKRIEDTGISMLAVHGRTLEENKTATKRANWRAIGEVRAALKIPVIGNGGIEYHSDIAKMISSTGVAGVMSSEGLLENPSLFTPQPPDSSLSPRSILNRQVALAKEYVSLAVAHPPVSCGGAGGHSTVKAHVFKILYRALDNERFHDLRNRLGDSKCWKLEQTVGIIGEVEERLGGMEDGEIDFPVEEFSWYRRHRKPVNVQEPVREMTEEERKAAIRERLIEMKMQREEKERSIKRCIVDL